MTDEEVLKRYNYCCDKLTCLTIANSWNNLLKLKSIMENNFWGGEYRPLLLFFIKIFDIILLENKKEVCMKLQKQIMSAYILN